MKTMNFFLVLMLLAFLSCSSGQSGEKNKNAESNTLSHSGKVINLSKDMFIDKVMNYVENPNEWKYKGDLPCLIDFYADWCAPCRITAPILDELAKEYAGKVIFYKIDTQKEQELAALFGIQSIPTFLFCPVKGNPSISSGIAQTPEQTKMMFRQMINQYLILVD